MVPLGDTSYYNHALFRGRAQFAGHGPYAAEGCSCICPGWNARICTYCYTAGTTLARGRSAGRRCVTAVFTLRRNTACDEGGAAHIMVGGGTRTNPRQCVACRGPRTDGDDAFYMTCGAAECIHVVLTNPERLRCSGCGCLLRDSELDEGACESVECKVVALNLRIEQEKRALQKWTDDLVAEEVRAHAERHGLVPESIYAVVVEGSEGEIAPYTPARRSRFIAQLQLEAKKAESILLEYRASGQSAAQSESEDTQVPSPHLKSERQILLDRRSLDVCGACRGGCCHRHGGDHGFVRSERLALTSYTTHQSLAESVRDYVAHLPEYSCKSGCVFQSRSGCSLPRTKRSDTCNNFICGGLRRMRAQLQGREDSPILVVAVRGFEHLHSTLLPSPADFYLA